MTKFRRIIPVILHPSRKRAAGYISLVIFDDRGNLVRKVARRVRRASEALARHLAEREKRDLEAQGFQVAVDPVTKEIIE